MAAGQPHDCVTVERARQAGMAHVWHSTPVSVTVGHPVCVGPGIDPVGRMDEVIKVAEFPSCAEANLALDYVLVM